MAFPLEETGIGLEDDFFAVAAKRSADTSIDKRGKDRDGMAIVAVVWFHVSLGRVCDVYVAGRYYV